MIVTLPPSASSWTEEQRAKFYGRMSVWQKDEVAGLLLALFLGSFGAHHFYLHRTGLGILYCAFFWTGIPAIVSFVECFFMPARVRRYNFELAVYCAAGVGATPPTLSPVGLCSQCGARMAAEARFCSRCGAQAA